MKSKVEKMNFQFLLFSTGFANLADGIGGFALVWLFSLITRDAQLISLAATFGSLPQLIFILFAGVIADKYNRKRILITTRFLQSLIVGFILSTIFFFRNDIPSVVIIGSEPEFQGRALFIAVFYICSFFIGVLEVTRDNASQSFLPEIISKKNLKDANGKLLGVEIVTNNLFGAPLGGFLVGISLYAPFYIVIGLLVFSTLFVSRIRGDFDHGSSSLEENTFTLVKEGVRWISKEIFIKRLALFTGAANFVGAMAFPIMILFAQEVLLLNAIEFGFLTYGAAIGGILGSLIANKIYSTIGESNGISLCVFLFALGGLIIYFTSSPLISAFAFSLMSFGAVMWNVIAVSIRQELVPNKLLGRVNSVYRLIALGATPLGALMSGTLVKFSENFISRESALRVPFLILGLAMMMLFILSFYLLSQKLIDNTRKKSKNKS